MNSTLQDWLESAVAYLKDHWQEHVLPAVVFLVGQLVVSFGLAGGYFAFLISFVAVERYPWVPVVVMGFLVLALLVYTACLQIVFHGYMVGIFRSMRGEPLSLGAIFGSLSSFPSVLGLLALSGTAGLLGTLMCWFPGLLVGIFLSLAPAALADRNQGAMDALATSYDLVRGRFWEVAVWFWGAILLLIVASAIPLIGAMIAVPVFQVAMATAYLFLVRDQARAAA